MIAALLLGQGSIARADDAGAREEAAQFFRAAMAAYDRADFPAAARAFEAANARAPDASTVYNAARAWDAAHDDARAAEAYAAATTGATLDESARALAVTRLAALDRRIAVLFVTASFPATVSVDRVHNVRVPVWIRLPPGSYDVTIESPDRPTMHRSWVGRAGEHETLDLVPAVLEAQSPALAPLAPRAPAVGPNRLEWAGIGVLAVGAAAAAAAAGLGVATLSTNDDYNASGHTSASLRSRAVTLQTLTNVAWSTAGVGTALGAVLLGVGLGKKDATATVRLSASGVLMTLRYP